MTSVLYDAPGPKARRRSLIASLVTGAVLLAALGWVIATLAGEGLFDADRWDIFQDPLVWLGLWERGLLVTLQVAALASVLAVLLGSVFAVLRLSSVAAIRIPVTIVLEFFRGMPVLLMMFFILILFSTSQYWAVVLGLTVYNGAIIGEALRSGIVALPKGQREAGLALGLTPLKARLLIEFPQAFRAMTPIIVAQLVVLLKDTSLGYIVGYNELIRTMMNNLASFYGNRYLFSLFFVCLIIYLAINLSLSWFARWLARRTASGGRKAKRGGADVDPDQAILVAQASASARQSGNAPGF